MKNVFSKFLLVTKFIIYQLELTIRDYLMTIRVTPKIWCYFYLRAKKYLKTNLPLFLASTT